MVPTLIVLKGRSDSMALAHWIRRAVDRVARNRQVHRCSVVMTPVQRGGGPSFEVVVRWQELGRECVARAASPDPFLAVRDAFDDVEIRLPVAPVELCAAVGG